MTHQESIHELASFLQTPAGEESLTNLLTSFAELTEFEVSAFVKAMSDNLVANAAWRPMSPAHQLKSLQKDFHGLSTSVRQVNWKPNFELGKLTYRTFNT